MTDVRASLAIDLQRWEELFDTVAVFFPEDWDKMLEVNQNCIWCVSPMAARTTVDGLEYVAVLSPGEIADNVIGYIQTEQEAALYKVELTSDDLQAIGMGPKDRPATEQALDDLQALRERILSEREAILTARGVGEIMAEHEETLSELLERLRQPIPPFEVPDFTQNPELQRIREEFRASLKAVHRRNRWLTFLDRAERVLPYVNVLVVGIAIGALIERKAAK